MTSVIAKFRERGWLVPASLHQKLDAAYRLPELKALCAERGLTLSGRKQSLIERLVAADSEGMRLQVSGHDVLICSFSLVEAVEAHLARKSAVREVMRSGVQAAVEAGDLERAAALVVSHAQSDVFGPGPIGPANAARIEDLARRARAIMATDPGILRGVPAAEIPVFRRAAIMMELLGESDASGWLPDGLIGHPRLAPDVVARMLLFAARTDRDKADFAEAGITHVHVLGGGEDSCDACRKIDGRRYALADAPELPLPECTHRQGCRCGLVLDLYEG